MYVAEKMNNNKGSLPKFHYPSSSRTVRVLSGCDMDDDQPSSSQTLTFSPSSSCEMGMPGPSFTTGSFSASQCSSMQGNIPS